MTFDSSLATDEALRRARAKQPRPGWPLRVGPNADLARIEARSDETPKAAQPKGESRKKLQTL